MEKPLVSVIIPVYNIPNNMLADCVDSLQNQTLQNIEFIFVNDCSPNIQNLEYVKEKQKYDKRIRVISLEKNQGVSTARNFGLDVAKGEYIGFVDADDWIETNMYEILYNKAITSNADIVECGINCYLSEENFIKSCHNEEVINIKSNKDYKIIYQKFFSGIYNKIYHRNIVKNIFFDTDISNNEDYLFNCLIFIRIKNYYIVPDCLYNYRYRADSASRKSFGNRQINSILLASIKMMDFSYNQIKNNKELTVYIQNRIIGNSLLSLPLFPYFCISDNKIFNNYIYSLTSNKIGFPYLYKFFINIFIKKNFNPRKIHKLQAKRDLLYFILKCFYKYYL